MDDNAENIIIVVAGANAGLTPDDVRAATFVIQNADVLLCQLETPLDATLEAFRLVRSAGVRTVLTPAPAVELPDELLKLCDLCVPNETELELLTQRKIAGLADAESATRVLRDRGIGAVIVTMGRRGALVMQEDGSTHIPAIAIESVDPTGAGDAFTAALAVYLGGGQSLVDAARHASVVAALTVMRIGTQAAFPSVAEVEGWLARNGR